MQLLRRANTLYEKQKTDTLSQAEQDELQRIVSEYAESHGGALLTAEIAKAFVDMPTYLARLYSSHYTGDPT